MVAPVAESTALAPRQTAVGEEEAVTVGLGTTVTVVDRVAVQVPLLPVTV